MLSLCFYNLSSEVPGDPKFRANYTTDGFKELIDVGLFKLPHTNVTEKIRGIDLRIFRIRVEEYILTCKIPHPERRAIINAVRTCNYMVGNQ